MTNDLKKKLSREDKINSSGSLDLSVKASAKILPGGWKSVRVRTKKNFIRIHLEAPDGTRFASKKTLMQYVVAKQLPFKLHDFNWEEHPMTIDDDGFSNHPSTLDNLNNHQTSSPLRQGNENESSADDSFESSPSTPPQVRSSELVSPSSKNSIAELNRLNELNLKLKTENMSLNSRVIYLEREVSELQALNEDTVTSLKYEKNSIKDLTFLKSSLECRIAELETELELQKSSITSQLKSICDLNMRINVLEEEKLDLIERLRLPDPASRTFATTASQTTTGSDNSVEDIGILVNESWLSDSIIDSCIIHSNFNDKNIYVFDSAVSLSIKLMSRSDLFDQLELLDLKGKKMLACLVNNGCIESLLRSEENFKNDNSVASSYKNGSHWSLLLFDLASSECLHLDSSISSMNSAHASLICQTMSEFLNLPFNYRECITPSQVNGYDCGVEAFGNLVQSVIFFRKFLTLNTFSPVRNNTNEIRKNMLQFLILKKFKSNRSDLSFNYDFEFLDRNIDVLSFDSASDSFHSLVQLDHHRNKSLNNQSNKKFLIIGDSMLKYTWRFLNRKDTEVKCISGLNIKSFSRLINELPVNVCAEKVVIHVGTNDVKRYKNPDYLIGDYYDSFKKLKNKFPNARIVISGIIKRKDCNYGYLKSINSDLKWLAECFGYSFCDSNTVISFYHIWRDRVHLNNLGKKVLGVFLGRTLTL